MTTPFTLARLVLDLFDELDRDAWASLATLRLVRCDMARAAAGIPSFLG